MKTHTLLLLTLLFYPSLLTVHARILLLNFARYVYDSSRLTSWHSTIHSLMEIVWIRKLMIKRRDSEAKLNLKIKLRDWQPTALT